MQTTAVRSNAVPTLKRVLPAAILLFISLDSSSVLAFGQYALIDLGTLGGTTSGATAINNSGSVVGSAETAAGTTHAFYWTHNAGIQDLTPTASSGSASDINNNENVVGTTGTRAFRWTASTGVVTLEGSRFGPASSVNDNNLTLGFRLVLVGQSNQSRTTEWSATNVRANIYPDDNTTGIALNNAGQFVGMVGLDGYYSVGPTSDREIIPVIPTDINDSRQITGSTLYATNPSRYDAVLYDRDSMTRTVLDRFSPTDSAVALGINQAGTVVGTSQLAGGFIYDPEGGVQPLTSLLAAPYSDWMVTDAEDINDFGAVVGTATHNGASRAVLLMPLPVSSVYGDLNADGRADAADYVFWRHRDGDPADYDLWRAHFGDGIAVGGSNTAVPEPSVIGLLLLIAASISGLRFRD
jgi:probable HAF family extracellular repeat protein